MVSAAIWCVPVFLASLLVAWSLAYLLNAEKNTDEATLRMACLVYGLGLMQMFLVVGLAHSLSRAVQANAPSNAMTNE